MSKVGKLLVAGGCIAMTGCGGSGNTAQLASASPETLVGEVQLTGSEPVVMVTVRTESGREVIVTGVLRAELRNLSGAVVAVQGKSAAGSDFEVQSYEVRSIEGEEPSVGVLVERDGDIWLDGDGQVRLVEVPARLQTQIGAKVWILGRSVDGGLHPQTFGVIRRPGG